MLTGVHILLTYTCTYECDHCFLHCSPRAHGTFTLEQLQRVFREIENIGSVETVYFEGGEPFLYYPLMLEGLRIASRLGLKAGIVTNAYWATSVEDAKIWLEPIREVGIADFSISDDSFHESTDENSPAKRAHAAATELQMPCDTICIAEVSVRREHGSHEGKGQPVIGGDVCFRGRAAEKLTPGLPRRRYCTFTTCPDEDLEHPERVHLDCFGNVHLCQGLCMGNMWVTPLSELVRTYDATAHPVCGPLVEGGPLELAKLQGIALQDNYVDECHYCYAVRRALVDRFPEYLAPRRAYGLE